MANKVIPPRGLEPLKDNTQLFVNKELIANSKPVLPASLDIILQKHLELKQIIAVWPELPDHIKQTIQTLVGTVTIAGNDNVNK